MSRLRDIVPGGVRFSVLGSLVWSGWLLGADPGPIETLVALSPLVLHPLLLELADGPPGDPLRRWVAWLQLPAAGLFAVGLSWGPGPAAGHLTLPWLGVTLLTAVVGLRRLVRRRNADLVELAVDAGLVMLVVGGAWASAASYGMQPMGFTVPLPILTGAHFHYAGFALPILAGVAGRRLTGRGFVVVPLGVTASVPLTAIGIAWSPSVEVFAAVVVAVSGAGLGVGQLVLARREPRAAPMALFAVSSLALFHGMTFAVLYAVGEFRGQPWPAMGDMVHLHGTVNALGFALLSTWAWTLHERPLPEKPPHA